MNSKQTKKVKLPEEESNGYKNKGRDPKDESSSTPDREGERADVPEYFAKTKESFFYVVGGGHCGIRVRFACRTKSAKCLLG